MKVLRKLCVLVLVGIMWSGAVGCSNIVDPQSETKKQNKNTVVAKVNGVDITRRALEQQLVYLDTTMQWQYGEDYAKNKEAMAYYEQQKRLIVDYLVEVQVLIAQADSLGVKVTDKDIADQLELLKADYDTEEAFNKALTTSGMTLDELKIMLKEDLIVNQVIAVCSDGIIVTDQEAKTYYKDNLDQFKVEVGATVNKETTVRTFEEVVDDIKTNLLTEKQNAIIDEKLKGWKSKMDIEIYDDNI